MDYRISWSLYPSLPGEFRFSLVLKAISHCSYFLSFFLQVPPPLLSPSEFLTKKIRSLGKRFLKPQSPTYKFSCTHSHTCPHCYLPQVSRVHLSGMNMSSAQHSGSMVHHPLCLPSPSVTSVHTPLSNLLLFSTRTTQQVGVRHIFTLFSALCI